MRVKEVMKKTVRTIAPDRPLSEAAEIMKRFDINHVVVTEHGDVAGILSDGDIARNEGAANVGAAMSRDVVEVADDELISHAANLMRGHGIKSVVVRHGEKLAGILTVTDLLEVIGRTGHPERQVLRDRGIRPRRSGT
ncbi:MAG TPA: CBS domain-containing protein [Thermoanaerobaculia bacterium]